jgi:hypothetical protein
MSSETNLLTKRDNKAIPHLNQYAPVWLTDEQTIPDDETVLFNTIFLHKDHGWINRKYRYDGFNNVLYYRGQSPISEEEAIEIQKGTPYITTLITDAPNSYGG